MTPTAKDWAVIALIMLATFSAVFTLTVSSSTRKPDFNRCPLCNSNQNLVIEL
jgi:hypothetical protein